MKKADMAVSKLESARKKYEAAEKKYTESRIKTDVLKEKKERKFFDILAIKISMIRAGHMMNVMRAEKKAYDELYEEAFALSAAALEELTKEFMHAKKPEKEKIFALRQKYASFLISGGIFKTDKEPDLPLITGSRSAYDDIVSYRNKIRIQKEHRLLIAREETEVIKEAKKAGINVDKDYENIVFKAMEELNNK